MRSALYRLRFGLKLITWVSKHPARLKQSQLDRQAMAQWSSASKLALD